MTMIRILFLALLLAITGCVDDVDDPSAAASPVVAESDSAFEALQDRGASMEGMGVDQYTSAHQFDDLPDGGRIELQRQVEDSAGVEQIRSHLQHIADAFAAGDFRIPAFVHDRESVPGTSVMAARRDAITYEYRDLPRGGEVRMTSDDPEAVGAIHEFLAFQRQDHQAGGHEMHQGAHHEAH